MWDKDLRTQVFFSLYQLLFWQEIDSNLAYPNSTDFSWWLDLESTSKNSNIERQLVEKINIFIDKQELFEQDLREHVKDWNRTFVLVKANLFCFLLEFAEVEDLPPQSIEKLPSRYLRLIEEYAGSSNVPLVHAVILKILPVKSELTDETKEKS